MIIAAAGGVTAALTVLGLGQSVAASLAAHRLTRFAARRRRATGNTVTLLPPVTILKPLHGDEPLLEAALASFCAQDYPRYQIVFGVQHPDDPAVGVVNRLQAQFPDVDIALVIDTTQWGANRKVGNLLNMLPAAKHDVLLVADSDLHVLPTLLTRAIESLLQPGVGLVTTLYAALPASRSMPALLGAGQINHVFLPGAILARTLGRQDCLGATMTIRRRTLDRIGGFRALVDHLADDNVLGRLVRAEGLDVALAQAVPATTVPETTYAALWRHELRWARTIRALVPVAFAASALQFPLGWAMLTVLIGLAGAAPWIGAAALGYVFAFAVRAATARSVERAVRPSLPPLADPAPLWLLPVRDVLSLAIMVASYRSDVVDWRGHQLVADDGISKPSPVAAVLSHHRDAVAAPIERRLRRLRAATRKGLPTP